MAKNKRFDLDKFVAGVKANLSADTDNRKSKDIDSSDNPSDNITVPDSDVQEDSLQVSQEVMTNIEAVPDHGNIQADPLPTGSTNIASPGQQGQGKDRNSKSEGLVTAAKKKGRGRPQIITDKLKRQVFKVDSDVNTKLMMIKFANKIDLQDVCYAVIADFLDTHYVDHATGLDSKALDLIHKTLEKHK